MVSITFPTLLTLVRLVVSPIILPLLLVYGLPLELLWVNGTLAAIFVFFSLTDFFDGYLARRLKQESALGKALDPLADKFLVYSTLVALLAIHKIYFYWVVILIGRDFFMMGLRQIALEHNFSVSVSGLGKIKTAVLLIYLTMAILNPYQGLWDEHPWWNGVETMLLAATLVLAIWSAKKYYSAFIKQFMMHVHEL